MKNLIYDVSQIEPVTDRHYFSRFSQYLMFALAQSEMSVTDLSCVEINLPARVQDLAKDIEQGTISNAELFSIYVEIAG